MSTEAKPSLLLFDLDGTLLDHFKALHRAYVHALTAIGEEPPTLEKVRRSVGGSAPVTMRKLVGEAKAEQALPLFMEHFRAIALEDAYLLPGAAELLEALHGQGKRLAVFTNKDGEVSRALCEQLGITPYLERVFGSNDTPYRKPEPAFTDHVLTELQAEASDTLLVGDSPFDIGAATCRGIEVHCVTTGSHEADELRAVEPPPDGVHASLPDFAKSRLDLELPLAITGHG